MKNKALSFPELLKSLAFLLYLYGSSLTLFEHGIELSLWLMTFAVIIDISTTLLPWLGFNWLTNDKKGYRMGYWISVLINIAAWSSFGYAMYQRLWRNLIPFYRIITITTLLWAAGLLIFIYSRHVCKHRTTGDTLNDNPVNPIDNHLKGSK